MNKKAPACSDDYCLGAPSEPELSSMGDDWPNGNGKPKFWQRMRSAQGHGALADFRLGFAVGLPWISDWDDASEEFDHYLDGDGSDWTFDYEEAYREDENIRRDVDVELGRVQTAAADLATSTGLTSFQITGKNQRFNGRAATSNWIAALDSYNKWSSADVTVDGGRVTVRVTVHGVDRYNFNKNASFHGLDDSYFGELAEVGLAKNYTLRGTLTREITFSLGGESKQKVTAPPAPGRTSDENRFTARR